MCLVEVQNLADLVGAIEWDVGGGMGGGGGEEDQGEEEEGREVEEWEWLSLPLSACGGGGGGGGEWWCLWRQHHICVSVAVVRMGPSTTSTSSSCSLRE